MKALFPLVQVYSKQITEAKINAKNMSKGGLVLALDLI